MNSECTLNNNNSGAGNVPTPSSTPTTSNPTIINGRYKVLRELNRGGTAVVYEGQDLHSIEYKSVALKIMSLKDGKATMPLASVKREVEYAASLQHENIVRLIDFVIDGQTIIIVWEIIVGPDLLDLLNECGGRMDEKDAAFYFSQLLQAVDFIHSNGLCHRDLKPENCMIDRATKMLKVIDFGLSKHQASAVTLGVGTPDYMSPELLGGGGAGASAASALVERRTGHYDARAIDVWAMGVLLYLLVSGQYPFEDPAEPHNVVRTLQNIAAGRIRPLPRRTSAECASLLGAMLTKDPAQRITLASIAQHPWMNMWNVQKSEKEFSFGRVGNKIAAAKTSTGEGGGGAETPRVFTIAASSTTTNTTTTAISTPTPKTPDAVKPPPSPPTVMMMMNNNRDIVIPVTPPASTRVDLMDVDSAKKPRLGSICKLLFGGH